MISQRLLHLDEYVLIDAIKMEDVCDIQAVLLKGRSLPPFPMFSVFAGWNADVMVWAEAAIQNMRGDLVLRVAEYSGRGRLVPPST